MSDDYDHHGIGESKKNLKYPNETIRLLHERASVRSFEDKAIPDDILKSILEAGIHAPTGGNLQPYSIIKVADKETNAKLGKMCGQEFVGTAPVNLLFCIDWRRLKRWSKIEKAPFTAESAFRHFWISFQDTVIAAQNICTAADAYGLGTCYIGTIIDLLRDIKDMFKLPELVFPVVLLCVGYPKHYPTAKKKLGVDVIVHDEVYNDQSDDDLLRAFNSKYPAKRMEITDERLARIEEVCLKVADEEFTQKCLDAIKETGDINVALRYFALHYSSDLMPQGNDDFMKIFKEFGFNWFEEYIFQTGNKDAR